MVSNNFVIFRVNKEQLDKLKSKAQEKGFKTLSDYFRNLSLNERDSLNKIIFKLYHIENLIKQMQEAMQNGRAKS